MARPGFRLDVHCEISDDGITALFGPSGCGKTTLLRCIAGLERIAGAQIRFNDEIWQDRAQFVPAHRRSIGYVFQESSLFPHLDVRGNLEFGFRRVPSVQRRVRFDDAVGLLGLEALLTHRASQLSGGQRQRVAIARALVVEPQLILFDEPTSELDPLMAATIGREIFSLNQRTRATVIVVSHDRDLAFSIASRIAIILEGEIVFIGTPDEVKQNKDPRIQKFIHAEISSSTT